MLVKYVDSLCAFAIMFHLHFRLWYFRHWVKGEFQVAAFEVTISAKVLEETIPLIYIFVIFILQDTTIVCDNPTTRDFTSSDCRKTRH